MRDIISEVELKQHIEESYTSFLRSCNNYKRGFESFDEVYKDFCKELYEGFYEYLLRIGLVTRFNDSTWERFTEDYALWKGGSQLQIDTGSAWLLNHDFSEADVQGKNIFFELMQAYSIPLTCFKPIPESCIKPKYNFNVYGTGLAGTIRFVLTDDGGMYSCDNPIGKEFALTDDTGLIANIFIDRKGKKDEIHNHMDPQYVGHGTIYMDLHAVIV